MSVLEQMAEFLADALSIRCECQEERVYFYSRIQPVIWVGQLNIDECEEVTTISVQISLQKSGEVITCQNVPSKRAFLEGLLDWFRFGTLRIVYQDDLISVFLTRLFELPWQSDGEEEVPNEILSYVHLEIANLCYEADDLLNAFWLLHTEQPSSQAALDLVVGESRGEA